MSQLKLFKTKNNKPLTEKGNYVGKRGWLFNSFTAKEQKDLLEGELTIILQGPAYGNADKWTNVVVFGFTDSTTHKRGVAQICDHATVEVTEDNAMDVMHRAFKQHIERMYARDSR
jgi:hypothetical protein